MHLNDVWRKLKNWIPLLSAGSTKQPSKPSMVYLLEGRGCWFLWQLALSSFMAAGDIWWHSHMGPRTAKLLDTVLPPKITKNQATSKLRLQHSQHLYFTFQGFLKNLKEICWTFLELNIGTVKLRSRHIDLTQSTMVWVVRPPVYSPLFWFSNQIRVGNLQEITTKLDQFDKSLIREMNT